MILLPFAITFPSIFISTASSVSGSIPLRDIFSESFNVKVSPDFVSLGVVNETSYPKASPSPAISFPSSSVLSVFSLTTGLMMLFEISFDSVSPAWRAFGSGSSDICSSSLFATFSSSTIASLSSSDSNISLFSSAFGVVSSVLFSFLSAATVSSILASLLAFSASISSFLETSFVSASSSATGSNFSSDTAGSSFSVSTTSSAGSSFSASATGASAAGALSATSDTEAFACGLSTSFVAADGVSTAFVSSDSDSESLSLVSTLASIEVEEVDSLPSSTAALTTVGEKKMQYPNTQDTNPTDSFLVPYLGFLLADFSFFFSIKSLNFSKILPPLIYTIYLLECNKKCKSPKVDKSLLRGFHSYRFYSIPLYSSF